MPRAERPPEPRRAGAVAPLPLAAGDLAEEDARELQALKRQLERVAGLAGAGYKERYLRRRLGVRMRARGVARYGEYARVLEQDPAEYRRLLDTLTINVSRFFRNPELWAVLRERVVPDLFALDAPRVRLWSAGAAAGEEAYSLAMLLLEHAHATGAARMLPRFELLATDIDRGSLERARAAVYQELALADTPPDVRSRWFETDAGRWRLRDEVRRMVAFEEADLLHAPMPAAVHLLLCRNVLIYFERPLQDELLVRLADAVAADGFLVLGMVETLLGPVRERFRVVANRERVFRRAA